MSQNSNVGGRTCSYFVKLQDKRTESANFHVRLERNAAAPLIERLVV